MLIDEYGRAHVTDFGIARSFGPAALAEAGRVLGTLAYLLPEQARGEKVDGRSDIYSLGIILYEMLAGNVPFPGSTPEEMVVARAFATHHSLSRAGVVVPGWLESIVNRCLASDPEERYQDALELQKALAAPPDATPARRSRLEIVGAGLAAGGAIAAIAWWVLLQPSSIDGSSKDEPPAA